LKGCFLDRGVVHIASINFLQKYSHLKDLTRGLKDYCLDSLSTKVYNGAMDLTPDALVQSFLKAANSTNTAVLVLYGVVENGQPVLRVASNRNKNISDGLLAWLNGTSTSGILNAAREIHDGATCPVCAVAGRDTRCGWHDLRQEEVDAHVNHIQQVVTAVKQFTGRTLNVITTE
jgi:hypothetical protein